MGIFLDRCYIANVYIKKINRLLTEHKIYLAFGYIIYLKRGHHINYMITSPSNPFDQVIVEYDGNKLSLHTAIEKAHIITSPLDYLPCRERPGKGELINGHKQISALLIGSLPLTIARVCEDIDSFSKAFFEDLRALASLNLGREYREIEDRDTNLFVRRLTFENEDQLESEYMTRVNAVATFLAIHKIMPVIPMEYVSHIELETVRRLTENSEQTLIETSGLFKEQGIDFWTYALLLKENPVLICDISRKGSKSSELKGLSKKVKAEISSACKKIVKVVMKKKESEKLGYEFLKTEISEEVLPQFTHLYDPNRPLEILSSEILQRYTDTRRGKDRETLRPVEEILTSWEVEDQIDECAMKFKSVKNCNDFQIALLQLSLGTRLIVKNLTGKGEKAIDSDNCFPIYVYILSKINDAETNRKMRLLAKMSSDNFAFEFLVGIHRNFGIALDVVMEHLEMSLDEKPRSFSDEISTNASASDISSNSPSLITISP
jgi:hypothetical protein